MECDSFSTCESPGDFVLIRDILARYYVKEEERFWAKVGEERLATFEPRTALSHSEAWGEDYATRPREIPQT